MTKKVDDLQESDLLAAVDLGSNSFHLVIARQMQSEIRVIDKLSEKVQLALGLDAKNFLDEPSQIRALDCLMRFSERLEGVAASRIRVVGTNTLRVAKNGQQFLMKAEKSLGYPIEIISGREEARLVFLGVAHSMADDGGSRLVIDIGGGSTELIIGEKFEAMMLESLSMGCVAYAKRFFPNGEVSEKRMQKAITRARRELLMVQKSFKKQAWTSCVGSSGSIRAISKVLRLGGWSDQVITKKGMDKLYKKLLRYKHFDEIDLVGLDSARRNTFHAGFSVLYAIFQALEIEELLISDGALREGVMYDLMGRIQHEDVRERTTLSLMERYFVDAEHADRIKSTALILYDQIADHCGVDSIFYYDMLRWAAMVHEIGLAISHTQFQQHGAYLLQYSDLSGFSRYEQQVLAVLVRLHRRKFTKALLANFNDEVADGLLMLIILLRLSVLLHRARSDDTIPVKIQVKSQQILLEFPASWLDSRPLTHADLESEQDYLRSEGFELVLFEVNVN